MNIKEHREKLGISKYRLAKMLDVAYITIMNWEEGRYKPNTENERKLKEIFGDDTNV